MHLYKGPNGLILIYIIQTPCDALCCLSTLLRKLWTSWEQSCCVLPTLYPQHLAWTLTWYICSTTDNLLNEVSLGFCECVILVLPNSLRSLFLFFISFLVCFVQLSRHFCLNCLLLHSFFNQTVVLVHLCYRSLTLALDWSFSSPFPWEAEQTYQRFLLAL